MKYQFVTRDNIGSRMREGDLTPDVIYQHFLNYTDECIYIVEDETLIGIITPGDLHRFYTTDGENSYLNKKFTYIEEINFGKAKEVFERIPMVHEVPVIKEQVFLGIVKSGDRKPSEEWTEIREGFLSFHFGKLEWRKREISFFLEHTQANVYVYLGFDEKKLKWNDRDWELYNRKRQYPQRAQGLREMSEYERKAFFGSNYSGEYVEEFVKEISMLCTETHNGMSRICDISGRYFNVSDGKRKSCTVSEGRGKRRIYFIGTCMVFGFYVSDSQTIESYIWEMINRIELADFEMLNCGLTGFKYFHKLLTEGFAQDDIIVYMAEGTYDYFLWEKASREYDNVKIGSELTEAYNGIENPTDNILNSLFHCNHVINQRIANIIYEDIKAELLTQINFPIFRNGEKEIRTAIQDYYIPWDIVQYYRQYIEEHEISLFTEGKVGAIVMNCNPFTKGHRYLIEQACLEVSYLYIFVVEEDQSFFSFEDRIEMVKAGTDDLSNVCVLPSGKYIISKDTFLQYFDKDNVHEIEDMSYDVRIFGEVVAKEFGIQYRFVGEEPFDKVTREYNETMKRILPGYGIELIEIPRKEAYGNVISASIVRQCLEQRDLEMMSKLVPQSTIDVCRRYM